MVYEFIYVSAQVYIALVYKYLYMCRRAYLDYRDVFCALNRRTFDVFVRIYEDGPIEKDKIGHEKIVKELIPFQPSTNSATFSNRVMPWSNTVPPIN